MVADITKPVVWQLAKAGYDVLVGGLRLRQASGTLKADDLQSINGLLKP